MKKILIFLLLLSPLAARPIDWTPTVRTRVHVQSGQRIDLWLPIWIYVAIRP